MRHLKTFESFSISEEDIKAQHKNERDFINKMDELSKTILNDSEEDTDHPIHDKIGAYMLNIYDNKFFNKANKEGLNEEDYKEALAILDEKLKKFRESSAGIKAEERWQKSLEKQNSGAEPTEENED